MGGIGYILNFIPYVNFVSPILVAIAWILMGREAREKAFTALGVMLLVLFVGGAAVAVTVLAPILAFAPTGPGAGPSAGPGALLGILITVGAVFLMIALAAVILDILAHFKAAGIFDIIPR